MDPLAFDPAPFLVERLEDPALRVVMHGAAYDLRLLARDLGIRVRRLADTQIAASLVGEPAVGLQALLERHLGVRVSKKYQRADWAARPLSREMIDYAAGDTRHLHRLIAVLEGRLAEMGRASWAEEECRVLVRSACEDAGDAHREGAPDPIARFKGAQRLDDRSVTALRELIGWRDAIARELDRAPFRVAGDAALAAAVAGQPRSVRALADVQGFPARLARRHGASLIRILQRVRRLPESELKPYPRSSRRRTRADPEEVAAFERLRKVRNRAGVRLGLEPGRVMPNHVLRAVVAARPRTVAELAALDDVRAWQAEVIGGELVRALGR